MHLVRLKQNSKAEIQFFWSDGHEGPVPLQVLRDACPCAGCKGETLLLHSYAPLPADKGIPGRYALLGAEQVGGYAVKFSWGDGHSLGLYTWDLLRSLCVCPDCALAKKI